MAKAGRGSYSREEGESDAFSVDVEHSMATLEARGRYAAASLLVGRQRRYSAPLLRHLSSSGDVGVVVHVYPRQEAYEVEFVTLAGQTGAIVTASADQIRPIGKREIPHARELAHR
jgi:hypothetical protein